MEMAAAAVLTVAAMAIFLPPALTRSLDEQQQDAGYPVDAVDLLEREHPQVRAAVEYGWGGYVIYRLFDDGGRVFVDGRNDMYAEQILDDYTAISNGDAEWQRLADAYGVEALLFPPSQPITKGLAQAAGWCEAHRDADSVLLLRECAAP
jgi:hypothetical protein